MLPGAPATIEYGLPLPLLPHQWEVLNPPKGMKAVLQSGSFGSGKTLTNAWNALQLALKYPGTRGLCGAETGPQLKETLQADFDALTADFQARGLIKYVAGARKYEFWNGSEILFWTLVGSAPEKSRHRLRSLNLSWAIVEEITSIPEETIQELSGRLRQLHGPRILFGSCNPDGPGHYLYRDFIDPDTRKDRYHFIKSNYASNPYLPPDYIEHLFNTYPENIIQRYLMGEWMGVDGLVYATFDVGRHVIDPIPPSKRMVKEKLRAIDFGGTDPHCVLWAYEDHFGNVYITDEWYQAEVSLGEMASVLKANPVGRTYCDHDVTDRLTLTKDYKISGLVRARKEINNGIDTVLQGFATRPETGKPRVHIFRNCKNLIRELSMYAWATMHDKGVENHAVDTLRYILHSKFHGQWKSGSYLGGIKP